MYDNIIGTYTNTYIDVKTKLILIQVSLIDLEYLLLIL